MITEQVYAAFEKPGPAPAQDTSSIASISICTTYIVVPTLNEASNLRELFAGIAAAMPARSFRVVIVDDGSTDGTQELVASMARSGYPVELLERGSRLGIGSAVRDGLRRCLARGDAECIVTMDADLSHDPFEIPKLVDASRHADLVQGSRYADGGRIENWGLGRRLLSLSANALVNVLLRTEMKEHTTYFRAYSPRGAEAAVRAEGCDGYDWALGSLLAVQQERLPVREVPITFRERNGGSSKLTARAMVSWLSFLLRRGARKLPSAHALARLPTFAAVGATGIVVNQGALYMLVGTVALNPLLALAMAIEVSIIWNFALNERWTFREGDPAGRWWKRMGKYHAVCAAGIAINLAMFALLTFGLGVNYMISNLIAIIAAFSANFLGSASWTWVGR